MTSQSTRLTRDQQRARTRTELLDAAADVFASKGFHAASVDDVAIAAGYTKGAVYSNFSSKEELFLALFDLSASDTVSAVDDILALPPDERLSQFGKGQEALSFLSPRWQLLETEFILYVARNPHLRPVLVERQLALRQQVATRVSQHLEDTGTVTEHTPETLARLIGAAGDGLALQLLAEGDDAPDIGELFGALLGIVFRGVASAPATPRQPDQDGDS